MRSERAVTLFSRRWVISITDGDHPWAGIVSWILEFHDLYRCQVFGSFLSMMMRRLLLANE